MAWQLKGTYLENCNCDVVCPCSASSLTLPADNDRCRVVLAFHVESGKIDGVDVGNLTVAVLADTPRMMQNGNWRVGLFMDAAASKQQAEKLGAVFSGQMGGPMGALKGLIGQVLGMETAPIHYRDDGRRHSVKIGSLVDIDVEDVAPPQAKPGEVSRLTGIFHPANSTLTIAKATKAQVKAFGLDFSNTGKNGHSAPFSWAG